MFMDEAFASIDPEEALLGRLAALDFTLAEHLHDAAMDVEHPKDKVALSNAYHRVTRSLRQTVALKAQMRREREKALRADAHSAEIAKILERPRVKRAPANAELAADAVARVIWDEREPNEHEALFETLGDLIMVRVEADDDLGGASLDELVTELCAELGLTPQGAAGWRELDEQPMEGSIWFDFDRYSEAEESG